MPSPDQIALNFKTDGVYHRPRDQLKMFSTLAAAVSVNIPDFISKHDFDLFLIIFNNRPAIDMMKPDTFSHVLRIAEYLNITSPYIQGFFSYLSAHSILGTHKLDILGSQIHHIVPKGSRVYTQLALGLANALGLHILVRDGAGSGPEARRARELVFHTPQHPPEHKVLGFSTGITRIKITHPAQKKARDANETDLLDITIWLFTHINAEGLDLSGCYVGENTIAKIADLGRLRVLDLSWCELRPGSLVPIGNSPALQEKLRELYANDNEFDLNDTTALALLTALKVLKLEFCKLQPGALVPIGNSPAFQKKLRQLHVAGNKFDLNDTTALALLAALEVLKLELCKLRPGALVPIGNSETLQETLRELHADRNRFGLNDTTALAPLAALKVLKLEFCKLRSRSLVPIGNSKALQKTLRELHVSGNSRFGLKDTRALALLAALKVLKLEFCRLRPGTLVPIGNSPALKRKLHELRARDNEFSLKDTRALASLTALKMLNLSNCKLQPGTLVPIGNSETLQETLRELHADRNEFDLNDTTALALLAALKVLKLEFCRLQPGTLVPIGNSKALQETLRELHACNSRFGLKDTRALALLTALKVLDLSRCGLQPGTLVPIGNSETLQETLRELHANRNTFGLKDTRALALLAALEVLDLSRCKLQPCTLVPIGNSETLQETLRELHADGNEFDLNDTTALALLTALEVLDLSWCELRSGLLVPIGSSETLQEALRELHAVGNNFDLNDTTALALLAALEVLKLEFCKLQPGALVPIGNSETLQETLRELHAGDNEFGFDDTTALALPAALEVLKLEFCKLQPGALVPIGSSETLQKTLCELHADENNFGINDTTALALLAALEVLSLSHCKLQPGALVPIGNSETLQETLRELDVTGNQDLGPEDERVITELRHPTTVGS